MVWMPRYFAGLLCAYTHICRLRCGNAQDICNRLLVRLLMRLILKHQIQIAMRQVPDCFTEIVRLTVVKPLMNCIG